jgi:uncharacterized membrane protein YeaQ/YmgE (transglycosylase-associated protein family)
MILTVLSWIMFGALVGWITVMIIDGLDVDDGRLYASVLIGVVGAVIGGSMINMLGGLRLIGQDFSSIFIAVIGSISLLVIARVIKNME